MLRLVITLAAGAIIGFNRGEHARPAGLRTTILVCLAASASMIQVNLLLSMSNQKQSLVTLDLMRLPLGILSGMGFIGGGAILRRGNLVLGVTTAATLWYTTVMGLCIGGGQIRLGLMLLGLAVFVLWGLKWLELRFLAREHRATLEITFDARTPAEEDVRRTLAQAGFTISSSAMSQAVALRRRTLHCELSWKARESDGHVPEIIDQLTGTDGVQKLKWIPREV